MHTAWYRTTRGRRPIRLDLSWARLASTLQEFRDVTGDKRARLRSAPLWSPVELRGTRCAGNVRSVSCLVLDHDRGGTVADALAPWDGYARVAHTTWNHSDDAPRCRVVVPLARPVPGAWWSLYYRRALARLEMPADPACSDPSRMYYLPCVGAGGPHHAVSVSGALLDAHDDAAQLFEAEQARRTRAAHRRAQAARELPTSARDRTSGVRLAIERLDTCAGLRLDVGRRYGARFSAAGDRARRATCPGCGRASVWWYIDRGGPAMCDHRSSCGYARRLYWYVLDLEGAGHGSY